MLRDISGWSRWLLREPHPSSRALLFALPHPGCGGETYRRWPRNIGRWEVCPVQLRRAEVYDRQPPSMSYRVLAESLASALERYGRRSIGFLGHRAMALLGFEAAIRLTDSSDREPLRVFVSGQPPPGTELLAHARHGTDAALAEDMFRVILEMGGNPLPSLVESQSRTLREDLIAADEYRTAHPVPDQLQLTTVSWSRDEELSPAAMEGWRKFGRVAAHVLPGDQYQFLSAPPELRRVLDTDDRQPE